MHFSLARHWRTLAAGSPGRRFRDRYHRARRKRKNHWAGRVLRLILAAVLLACALTLTVVPGPATPLFFLAGALIATDSLWMARMMDRGEVLLRRLLEPVSRYWLRLPVYGRVLLALTTTSLSIFTSITVYRLLH